MLSDCPNLKKVIWNENIPVIPEYTFAGSTALEEVVFPDTVIEFSKGTFRNCDALTNFDVPDNVKIIKAESFYSCDNTANKMRWIFGKIKTAHFPTSIENNQSQSVLSTQNC